MLAACSASSDVEPGVSPPPPNPCVAPQRTPGLARLAPWLGGTTFVTPVELVPAPGSSLIYVAEMYGAIKLVDPETGDVRVVADLSDRGMNVAGLRALAIHPTKPRAYVVVEAPPVELEPFSKSTSFDGELRVYDLLDDGSFDLSTESVILRVHIPGAAHGVDTLRFGPDGMLYVSVGDGRTSLVHKPPFFEKDKLRGTILRINVDGEAPYEIPPDNPFVGDPEMRDEVYAYGLRNPWKFSFDRATGDLWAGDVGEARIEEINRIVAGGNYGWPLLEGSLCAYNVPECSTEGTELPVFTYSHAIGNSITGGYVYRGSKIPALAGMYVYADFQAGGLFAIDLEAQEKKAIHLNAGEARPQAAALAEGADGELFVLDWLRGGIYTLEADGDRPERPFFAERLSETGCFEPGRPLVPTSGVLPYDVNVELWSDGLRKVRHLSLPTGTRLQAEEDGRLTLPPGGLTIKTFFDGDRPIETRFFGRQGDGEWIAATYAWNEDGTDAHLLDDTIDIPLSTGGQWTVPGSAQCFFCHQDAAGMSLGLEMRQLDRLGIEDAASENQLARLSRLNLLDGPLPALPPLAPIDGPEPLETRVRSYLHVNCSNCHRPGVAIFSPLDLRAETPFEATSLCNVIAPGDPEGSRMLRRMRTRGEHIAAPERGFTSQMPPVGTNVVDPQGTALLNEWITSGARCVD